MNALLLNIVLIQVVLPLMFVAFLWGQEHASRANWVVQAVSAGAFVGFALTVGNWGWTSFYVRGGILLALVVALVRSYLRAPSNWRGFTFGRTWAEKLFTAAFLFMSMVFIPLTAYALSGYSIKAEPVELAYPLGNGVYSVGQGGSNPLINYHNTSTSQRYALDIQKLNSLGMRASGLYPADLGRYAVFGDTVHSPCGGVAVEVVRDLPDYEPPDRDPEHAAGNFVVVECKGVRVFLAHMMQGSPDVEVGASVEAGTPLGRVGNSGNTTEPHLHIHAERNGEGVPMTFDGRFLVRNSIVWK